MKSLFDVEKKSASKAERLVKEDKLYLDQQQTLASIESLCNLSPNEKAKLPNQFKPKSLFDIDPSKLD